MSIFVVQFVSLATLQNSAPHLISTIFVKNISQFFVLFFFLFILFNSIHLTHAVIRVLTVSCTQKLHCWAYETRDGKNTHSNELYAYTTTIARWRNASTFLFVYIFRNNLHGFLGLFGWICCRLFFYSHILFVINRSIYTMKCRLLYQGPALENRS